MTDHVGVQVTALAGVDLQSRDAGGADAVGVMAGLLIALDHRQGVLVLEVLDAAGQQAGLAGAGAGDQVQGQDAPGLEPGAIGAGVLVVLAEDVLFDLHHAALAKARGVSVGGTQAVMMVAGVPMEVWVLIRAQIGLVPMGVSMGMVVGFVRAM